MKKLVFAMLLIGGMASPIEVKAQGPVYGPLQTKNGAGYIFDGHDVSEVAIYPYAGEDISTARGRENVTDEIAKLDNQVVYLYHPKTKRFLYADGDWGTLAVVRHEGFGMPLNIVSPRKSRTDNTLPGWLYYGDTDKQTAVGYGLYTESFDMGHYIGRDQQHAIGFGDMGVGKNTYTVNGSEERRFRIYIDRGGNYTYPGEDTKVDELFCTQNVARGGDVFNWHFEPVTTVGDDYVHLYRLCIYVSDYPVWNADRPVFKRYIKVEKLDILNDGMGCYMLTCDNDQVLDSEAEVDNMTDEPSPADGDADYYWQIITRKDLKEKFLRDYLDPYKKNENPGNANFNLDNPDFSRPLIKTINGGNDGTFATYWKEDPSTAYDFGKIGTDNGPFGRYSIMQTEDGNGVITQSFKTYQTGLFRFECQGFSTGNAKIKMSLKPNNNGIDEDAYKIVSSADGTGDNWVEFPKVSSLSEVDPQLPAMVLNEAGISLAAAGSGQASTPADWKVIAPNGTETTNTLNVTVNQDGVYRAIVTDKYGRKATGIYVAGEYEERSINYAHLEPGKDGWQYENNEITIAPKQTITFGPQVGDDQTSDRYTWYFPDGTVKDGRGQEVNFTYGNEGECICVYKGENGKYTVFSYIVKLNGTPDPSTVNLFVGNDSKGSYTVGGKDNVGLSFQQVVGTSETVQNQDDYINLAGKDRISRNRAVGKLFYDEEKQPGLRTVYVYVPEVNGNIDAQYRDIEIKIVFEGVNYDADSYVALDNARLTYMGSVPYVLDEGFVEDDLAVLSAKTNGWIPVYMNRVFNTGAWNALVCPVPLSAGQVRIAFGDKAKLSEISGLDPKNPYRITFESVDLSDKDARAVEPGHFYIVNPSEVKYESDLLQMEGTAITTFTSNHLVDLGRHNLSTEEYVALDGSITKPSELYDGSRERYSYDDFTSDVMNPGAGSNHNSIRLYGSYKQQTITAEEAKDCYVFASKATGETALFHLGEDSGDFSLKAFRFYIKDVAGSGGAKAYSFAIDGVEDIDESAGISGAVTDENIANGNVYNLAGQLVKDGNLKGGIYMKNGKKYIVK